MEKERMICMQTKRCSSQIQRRKECRCNQTRKCWINKYFCHEFRVIVVVVVTIYFFIVVEQFCCCYTAHISAAHTEECKWCYNVVYPKQCTVFMCMLFRIYLFFFFCCRRRRAPHFRTVKVCECFVFFPWRLFRVCWILQSNIRNRN